MAAQKPLVFDAARGVSRQLDPTEALQLDAGLQVGGPASFWGMPAPAAQPAVAGPWGQTLDELIRALAALGLLKDNRPAGWQVAVNGAAGVGSVGPYEPGRLIIGSLTGWVQLDQPAAVTGVIQVPTSHAGPPETNPVTGLAMRPLAYSPILSYGRIAPGGAPQAGALWYDTAIQELKVFDGSAWQPALPAAMAKLAAQVAAGRAGALLSTDGSGGLTLLSPPAGSKPGQVVIFDGVAASHAIDLVTVAAAAPWANGSSAYTAAPGGPGRPVGVDQAIWCNPSLNAETIGFWDETAHQWKTVYVNNPVLTDLAELRTLLADGDLFTVRGNRVNRLAVGRPGMSLTVNAAGALEWHQRFQNGPAAPTGAVDGDLWLEDGTAVVRVRQQGRWLDINEVDRFVEANGTGGGVRAGQPLTHGSSGWQLAGPTTPPGSLVAIALDAAAVGAPLTGAVGGVVSLTAAQWAAVIDAAEPHPAGGGLSLGRDYYVSSSNPGFITSQPAGSSGVPVGTALSSTHLLLRPSPLPQSALPARATVSNTAPAGLPGSLWWSDATQQLSVYQAGTTPGAAGQWVPLPLPAGTTPPAATAVKSVTSVEAIDWVPDPLAAAIRVLFSDGSNDSIRIRGAGGAVVTMADNRTLVIDAGGSAPSSGSGAVGSGLPSGAAEGQVLFWRGGMPVWGAAPTGAGAGVLKVGNGVQADAASGMITGVDEGAF